MVYLFTILFVGLMTLGIVWVSTPSDIAYHESKKSNSDNEKKLKKDNKLICQNCNSEQINSDALFCFNCGEDLYPKEFKEIIVCPECNKEYNDTYKFCEIDGTQLVNENVELQKKTIINKDEEPESTKDEFKSDFRKDTFTLGKFLIALNAFQGFLLTIMVIFDIQTDIIPDRLTALFTSIPIILGTYGLYKRRIYGLYLVYFNYFVAILIAIFDEDIMNPVRPVMVIISGLIMFSRVNLGCHTPQQVIVGGLLGTILGYLYYLNLNKIKSLFKIK